MTHVGYIVAAYTVTFVVLAVYAAWLVSRSRAVARALATQPDDHTPTAVVRARPDR